MAGTVDRMGLDMVILSVVMTTVTFLFEMRMVDSFVRRLMSFLVMMGVCETTEVMFLFGMVMVVSLLLMVVVLRTRILLVRARAWL